MKIRTMLVGALIAGAGIIGVGGATASASPGACPDGGQRAIATNVAGTTNYTLSGAGLSRLEKFRLKVVDLDPDGTTWTLRVRARAADGFAIRGFEEQFNPAYTAPDSFPPYQETFLEDRGHFGALYGYGPGYPATPAILSEFTLCMVHD